MYGVASFHIKCRITSTTLDIIVLNTNLKVSLYPNSRWVRGLFSITTPVPPIS